MRRAGPEVETIKDGQTVIAIVVRGSHESAGIEFLSPPESALQLGQMRRPAGYNVAPHVHTPIQRNTVGTQEVLFVKSGAVRVDLFSAERNYLESRELATGDLILLAGGGHGVEFLEESTLVEVKNGPYSEGADKVRFEAKRTT